MPEETKNDEAGALNGPVVTGNEVVAVNEVVDVNKAGNGKESKGGPEVVAVNKAGTGNGNVPVNEVVAGTTQTNESNPLNIETEENESEDEIILKEVQAIRTAITDYKASIKEDKKKKAAEIISKVKTLSIKIKGGAKSKKNKGSESNGNVSGNNGNGSENGQGPKDLLVSSINSHNGTVIPRPTSEVQSSLPSDEFDLKVFDEEFNSKKIVTFTPQDFDAKIEELFEKLKKEANKGKYNGDISQKITGANDLLKERLQKFKELIIKENNNKKTKTKSIFNGSEYTEYRNSFVTKQQDIMKDILKEINVILEKFIKFTLFNEKINKTIEDTKKEIDSNNKSIQQQFIQKFTTKNYNKEIEEKQKEVDTTRVDLKNYTHKYKLIKKLNDQKNTVKGDLFKSKESKIATIEEEITKAKDILFNIVKKKYEEINFNDEEKILKENNNKAQNELINLERKKQNCNKCINEIDKISNELYFQLSESISSIKCLFAITSLLTIKEYKLSPKNSFFSNDKVKKIIQGEYREYTKIFEILKNNIPIDEPVRLNDTLKVYLEFIRDDTIHNDESMLNHINKGFYVGKDHKSEFNIKFLNVDTKHYYDEFFKLEKNYIIESYKKINSDWRNFNIKTIEEIKKKLLNSLINKYINRIANIYLRDTRHILRQQLSNETAGLIYDKKNFKYFYKTYVSGVDVTTLTYDIVEPEVDIFEKTFKILQTFFNKDTPLGEDDSGPAGPAVTTGGYTNKKKKFIRNRITYKKI